METPKTARRSGAGWRLRELHELLAWRWDGAPVVGVHRRPRGDRDAERHGERQPARRPGRRNTERARERGGDRQRVPGLIAQVLPEGDPDQVRPGEREGEPPAAPPSRPAPGPETTGGRCHDDRADRHADRVDPNAQAIHEHVTREPSRADDARVGDCGATPARRVPREMRRDERRQAARPDDRDERHRPASARHQRQAHPFLPTRRAARTAARRQAPRGRSAPTTGGRQGPGPPRPRAPAIGPGRRARSPRGTPGTRRTRAPAPRSRRRCRHATRGATGPRARRTPRPPRVPRARGRPCPRGPPSSPPTPRPRGRTRASGRARPHVRQPQQRHVHGVAWRVRPEGRRVEVGHRRDEADAVPVVGPRRRRDRQQGSIPCERRWRPPRPATGSAARCSASGT